MATARKKADAADDDNSGGAVAEPLAAGTSGDVGPGDTAGADSGDASLGVPAGSGAGSPKRGRGRPRGSTAGSGAAAAAKPARPLGAVGRAEVAKSLADTAGALAAVAYSLTGFYQARRWQRVSEEAAEAVGRLWQIDRTEADSIGAAVAEVTLDLVPDEWLERTGKIGAVAQLGAVLYSVTARRLAAQQELAQALQASLRAAPPQGESPGGD